MFLKNFRCAVHSVHHEAFIPYFDLCPDSGDIAPSADDKAPYGLNRVLVHKLWITQNLRTPTVASLWFFHRPPRELSEYKKLIKISNYGNLLPNATVFQVLIVSEFGRA